MSATATPTTLATGKVVQVLGNVVDVEFPAESLPNINVALTVHIGGTSSRAGSNGASTLTFASAISGITVYSANVDVPMKCRIGSPSRDSRVVPSGRCP